MSEILAGLSVVTVLIVLLLVAVIIERVTRVVAVLRHTTARYTVPLQQLRDQTSRITAWREDRNQ